jgi:hypothetical protein
MFGTLAWLVHCGATVSATQAGQFRRQRVADVTFMILQCWCLHLGNATRKPCSVHGGVYTLNCKVCTVPRQLNVLAPSQCAFTAVHCRAVI